MNDLIIFNGNIVTLESKTPVVQAIAVKNGIIKAIGTNEEILMLESEHTKKIDLKGKLMLPGFIDSHLHLLEGGERLFHINLRNANSKEEFKAIFKENLDNYRPGEWILGGDWNHENWGGELPDKEWIDTITKENPVWIKRLDGHMGLANSLAIKAAGLNIKNENIFGGEVVVKNGKLTGIFKDNAMPLIENAIPKIDKKQKQDFLLAAMHHLAERGICSAHYVNLFELIDNKAIEELKSEKKLITRLYLSFPLMMKKSDARLAEIGEGDNWVKYGLLKGFLDGSLGSQTAAFFENYLDSDKNGIYLTNIKELEKRVEEADLQGFQIAIHAIGNRANHELLNLYERVIEKNGQRDRRFRIEHAQHLQHDDIARFGKLGIIPSMQPLHLADDGGWAHKIIGNNALKGSYVFKSLIQSGAKIAFGSDWFVADPSPILSVHAAVNRQTSNNKYPEGWLPEQKISVLDAVKAYTIDAAYASFDESIKGSIVPGKLADFVVLDRDIFSINPAEIKNTRVILTIVDGKVVFQAD